MIDPTLPYYSTRVTNRNRATAIVHELQKLIKFYNPVSMSGITSDDLCDLCENLTRDYEEKILESAFYDVKNFYANKNLTIGVFLEKCSELHRAAKEERKTQELIAVSKAYPKSVAKENLERIRRMLEESKPVKPLPYDKNKLERTYDRDADLRALANYSVLSDEIENSPDGATLSALYKKTWTVGLMIDEKEQFNELAAKFNRRYHGHQSS